MDICALKRDSASLENGMWVGDIPGPDFKPVEGVRLKVRGTDSDAYVFAMSRKQTAAEGDDLDNTGQLKPEALLRFRLELLAEIILLDWEGFTDNGKEVPYSPEMAREWLTNSDFRDFQEMVTRAAGMVNSSTRAKSEATIKN